MKVGLINFFALSLVVRHLYGGTDVKISMNLELDVVTRKSPQMITDANADYCARILSDTALTFFSTKDSDKSETIKAKFKAFEDSYVTVRTNDLFSIQYFRSCPSMKPNYDAFVTNVLGKISEDDRKFGADLSDMKKLLVPDLFIFDGRIKNLSINMETKKELDVSNHIMDIKFIDSFTFCRLIYLPNYRAGGSQNQIVPEFKRYDGEQFFNKNFDDVASKVYDEGKFYEEVVKIEDFLSKIKEYKYELHEEQPNESELGRKLEGNQQAELTYSIEDGSTNTDSLQEIIFKSKLNSEGYIFNNPQDGNKPYKRIVRVKAMKVGFDSEGVNKLVVFIEYKDTDCAKAGANCRHLII